MTCTPCPAQMNQFNNPDDLKQTWLAAFNSNKVCNQTGVLTDTRRGGSTRFVLMMVGDMWLIHRWQSPETVSRIADF